MRLFQYDGEEDVRKTIHPLERRHAWKKILIAMQLWLLHNGQRGNVSEIANTGNNKETLG